MLRIAVVLCMKKSISFHALEIIRIFAYTEPLDACGISAWITELTELAQNFFL